MDKRPSFQLSLTSCAFRSLVEVSKKVGHIHFSMHVLTALHNTVVCQINAPCVLTDTLVNSGGPEEYSRGFSAIFAHFKPIFAYFEGNISTESAGGALFRQARLFGKIWNIAVVMQHFGSCQYRGITRAQQGCWISFQKKCHVIFI